VTIEADRQAVAAVVGNLLQNAFNFTKPHTTVTLRVGISADRVPIQVEDECGGLPGGNGDALFRPFEQRSADRTGARTWSRLQQMGRRSQPWPDPHAQRTWSRMCVHRRLAAVPCSGARVICRLVRSKHSAHLLDADFATRRDAWVARGRVHELRALFRGGWLAALDDFRNWLIAKRRKQALFRQVRHGFASWDLRKTVPQARNVHCRRGAQHPEPYRHTSSNEISPVLREESLRTTQCQPPLSKHRLELGAKRDLVHSGRGYDALARETRHEAVHVGSLRIGHCSSVRDNLRRAFRECRTSYEAPIRRERVKHGRLRPVR
jgi:hypothetical protein